MIKICVAIQKMKFLKDNERINLRMVSSVSSTSAQVSCKQFNVHTPVDKLVRNTCIARVCSMSLFFSLQAFAVSLTFKTICESFLFHILIFFAGFSKVEDNRT